MAVEVQVASLGVLEKDHRRDVVHDALESGLALAQCFLQALPISDVPDNGRGSRYFSGVVRSRYKGEQNVNPTLVFPQKLGSKRFNCLPALDALHKRFELMGPISRHEQRAGAAHNRRRRIAKQPFCPFIPTGYDS